jgi:hypothetical protein
VSSAAVDDDSCQDDEKHNAFRIKTFDLRITSSAFEPLLSAGDQRAMGTEKEQHEKMRLGAAASFPFMTVLRCGHITVPERGSSRRRALWPQCDRAHAVQVHTPKPTFRMDRRVPIVGLPPISSSARA